MIVKDRESPEKAEGRQLRNGHNSTPGEFSPASPLLGVASDITAGARTLKGKSSCSDRPRPTAPLSQLGTISIITFTHLHLCRYIN